MLLYLYFLLCKRPESDFYFARFKMHLADYVKLYITSGEYKICGKKGPSLVIL